MGKLYRCDFAIYHSAKFRLDPNTEDRSTCWELFSYVFLKDSKDALTWGFKPFLLDGETCYYLPITPSQVESAYSITNYCECQGDVLECGYDDEKQEFTFDMRGVSKEICNKHGLGHAWERYNISRGIEEMGMVLCIPDSEIPNVWEEHLPIKDFPFKGPEKVWVKKDGVWLR
ncbi:MAG: hypothetical protein M0P12_12655 [Paludibacteraceae bacterium]|nr:hypothetical protein [Paludibacteraceae bacterium]